MLAAVVFRDIVDEGVRVFDRVSQSVRVPTSALRLRGAAQPDSGLSEFPTRSTSVAPSLWRSPSEIPSKSNTGEQLRQMNVRPG